MSVCARKVLFVCRSGRFVHPLYINWEEVEEEEEGEEEEGEEVGRQGVVCWLCGVH